MSEMMITFKKNRMMIQSEQLNCEVLDCQFYNHFYGKYNGVSIWYLQQKYSALARDTRSLTELPDWHKIMNLYLMTQKFTRLILIHFILFMGIDHVLMWRSSSSNECLSAWNNIFIPSSVFVTTCHLTMW